MEQKYNQCKIRNEEKLLNIRNLELEIAKTKQLVNNKHKTNLIIKEKNELYKNLTKQQKEYNIEQHKPKQQPKPVIGGKRDLSLLLAVTPEKICKRIEHLLRTRSLFGQSIEPEQLDNIRQLIDRLQDPYNPDTINKLLLDLINSLPAIVKLPINDTIDLEKERLIIELHSHRKRKVDNLKENKQELEVRCQQSESTLIHKVQQIHNDHVVQSALVKMIRMKAANQQIQSELRSMQTQTEAIKNQVQFIKDQGTIEENSISEKMENVAKVQYQAQTIIATNTSFDATLQDQNPESNDSKEVDLLVDRINNAISKLQKEPKKVSIPLENQSNELSEAKDLISPYSSISNIQLFKELVRLIQSINDLKENSIVDICKDIGKTLEELLEKWSSIFDEKDISLLYSLPQDYDGIDTIIQAFDSIRLYFEENERKYFNEEEKKLNQSFETINEIEEEIDRVQEAIDERKLITTVGQTFTVEDKSFCEWLEEVKL